MENELVIIVFLGPDGAGKTSVISDVIVELKGTTKLITYSHLKPSLFKQNNDGIQVTDPHGKPARGIFFSISKVVCWVLLYWYDRYFHGHKNLTLRIWDRYYYDLLIDPKRYRYGAPLWIAKMLGKFIPQPDLVILLDAPPEVLQSRKQEVPFKETVRQREAYFKYVKNLKNGVVIDASLPLAEVVRNTSDVVLKFMAKETG